MIFDRVLFDFFAAIAAASALATVTRRNILHAAILLLATLLATGGVFLQLQAEYAFAVQVLLFAGGIVLLFVLAVILLDAESLGKMSRFDWKRYAISAIALMIGIEIVAFSWARHDGVIWPTVAKLPANNTAAMGNALFRSDLLAFEFSCIPLLATVIGAVLLVKQRTDDSR